MCQAFDNCHELDSIFKLINIVGTILQRPIIRERFTSKYDKIVTFLDEDLTKTEVILSVIIRNSFAKLLFWKLIFEEQLKCKIIPTEKNMSPVAAVIKWTSQLEQRVGQPIENFKGLDHPYINNH